MSRKSILFILAFLSVQTVDICLAQNAFAQTSLPHSRLQTNLVPPARRAVPQRVSHTTITVAAVGDIMMGTNYPQDTLPANNGRELFHFVGTYLKDADIRFGNLEGPLFDGDDSHRTKSSGPNRFLFRTPVSFASNLAQAPFNVLSLANNHAKDFGNAGLNSTKQALRALDIKYSSKDGEVAAFEIKGVRVAVIATDYYPGWRSITTPERTLTEIRTLKTSGRYHIVIVSAHSGGEGRGAERVKPGPEIFMGENRGDVVGFSRKAIEAGADLILMHGPHVPRAMEIYRDRLIVYSLGNFLTERGISTAGNAGLSPLARIQLDSSGRFLKGHLASFQQIRTRGLVYDPGLQAQRLIENLSRTDFPDSAPRFEDTGFFFPR